MISSFANAQEAMSSFFNGKKDNDYNAIFKDVVEKVKKDYVDEVTDQKLIEAALEGMLSSLDPHSAYLTEKEYSEMRNSTKGEFGGIGVEITMEKGFIKIISPYEDSPAYKAGIKSGDFITMIDGIMVKGLSLSQAATKMRGKPKTKVKLTIYREATGESLEMILVRELVKFTPIKSKIVGGEVFWIKVLNFSENTASLLKKEYYKLVEQATEEKIEIKGVVLDLRGNPGGLLEQSREVTELFLEEGIIVTTKGRLPDSNRIFRAKGYDISDGLPMVVLINGGSASASEIVAGALQDNKRALVVGTRSFGKGSVQTIMPLMVNNSAIKLTTSRYYTPSGRSIQAQGIEPDVVVDDAVVTPIKNQEIGSEAALVGHLQSEGEQKVKNSKEDKVKILKRGAPSNNKEAQDFQLLRAIDLIKGMALYSERLTH
jgi:carboxyl-terminal processing protease